MDLGWLINTIQPNPIGVLLPSPLCGLKHPGMTVSPAHELAQYFRKVSFFSQLICWTIPDSANLELQIDAE
jgi:hypothetical protein